MGGLRFSKERLSMPCHGKPPKYPRGATQQCILRTVPCHRRGDSASQKQSVAYLRFNMGSMRESAGIQNTETMVLEDFPILFRPTVDMRLRREHCKIAGYVFQHNLQRKSELLSILHIDENWASPIVVPPWSFARNILRDLSDEVMRKEYESRWMPVTDDLHWGTPEYIRMRAAIGIASFGCNLLGPIIDSIAELLWRTIKK
ncbi:hypothetical protein PIB30_021988 [Stylosanthes scabra]|uniref:Aminotransferase-like plant mobile domain-containing protein n=1 Tax=Stylosanthes scabra TaxID=79078 RepID=A0ABU6WC32_9FABA|nr:hypothetical protein [Stylosanthes scabra]